MWARSSYLGGQRHSAQWSGDVNATWPGLASTMRGGLSHGLSGVPFWSHDTGGFHGTPDPELYVRWTQFGALSPLVRLHGTTSRLPWDFPAETERDAVAALRLRYRLMPYLWSAAVEAARTGAPMMRALLVDTPDDPTAWTATCSTGSAPTCSSPRSPTRPGSAPSTCPPATTGSTSAPANGTTAVGTCG